MLTRAHSDFLTDEQRMIRDTARDFARAELAPHAGAWEEEGWIPDAAGNIEHLLARSYVGGRDQSLRDRLRREPDLLASGYPSCSRGLPLRSLLVSRPLRVDGLCRHWFPSFLSVHLVSTLRSPRGNRHAEQRRGPT